MSLTTGRGGGESATEAARRQSHTELRELLHQALHSFAGDTEYSRAGPDGADESTGGEIEGHGYFGSHRHEGAIERHSMHSLRSLICPSGESFTITAPEAPVVEGCYQEVIDTQETSAYALAGGAATGPQAVMVSAPLDETEPEEMHWVLGTSDPALPGEAVMYCISVDNFIIHPANADWICDLAGVALTPNAANVTEDFTLAETSEFQVSCRCGGVPTAYGGHTASDTHHPRTSGHSHVSGPSALFIFLSLVAVSIRAARRRRPTVVSLRGAQHRSSGDQQRKPINKTEGDPVDTSTDIELPARGASSGPSPADSVEGGRYQVVPLKDEVEPV